MKTWSPSRADIPSTQQLKPVSLAFVGMTCTPTFQLCIFPCLVNPSPGIPDITAELSNYLQDTIVSFYLSISDSRVQVPGLVVLYFNFLCMCVYELELRAPINDQTSILHPTEN